MYSELEKKFFYTFGIEPKNISTRECKYKITPEFCESDCLDCKNTIKEATYPQITDRILLELICILTKRFDYADQNWLTKCNDIEELKINVLRLLLLCTYSIIEKYKHQVRTLFEEG